MLATILTLIVAAIHLYFLYLEMFKWEAPRTRKVFGTTPEFASESRVMAANQGLYNAFLGVGLMIGLVMGPAGTTMVLYLLICVLVAGLYGGFTVTKAAYVAQCIPATLALLAMGGGL